MSYKTGFYEGRLGIGLTSSMGMGDGNPRYPLDINGDIRLTGSIVNGNGQVLSLVPQESLWTIGNSNLSYTGGNVGIGTTSPDSKLHIKGSSSDNCTIRLTNSNAGTGFMYIQRNDDGKSYVLNQSNHPLILGGNNNTSQLYLKENGNVGIGTTSPDNTLQVVSTMGEMVEFKNTSTYSRFVLNGATSTGGDLIFKQNGTAKWGIANIGDDLHFLGDDSTSQQYMTIKDDGKVGIGTASPKGKLAIQNTNSLTNSSELDKYSLYFDSNDTVKRNGMAWSYYSSYGACVGITCSSFNADTLELWGTNGRRVNICAPSGNETAPWDHPGLTVWENRVGIGTTGPGTVLHIKGDDEMLRLEGTDNPYIGFYHGSTKKWSLGPISSADNKFYIRNIDTTGDLVLLDTGNGNVGIGTTGPGSKLTISHTRPTSITNSGDFYLGIGYNEHNPGTYRLIGFGYLSSTANVYPAYMGWVTTDNGGSTKGDLVFGTRDSTGATTVPSERMRIKSDGKVGIGTTGPGALLDVNGHGWCRTLCAGSYSTFSAIDGGDNVKLQISNSTWNATFGIEFSGYTNGHRGGNQALAKILCRSNDSNNYENHYISFKVRGWGTAGTPHHNPLNERFWFYGSGNATASNWNTSSDDRVKHNERNITNAINIINKLNAKLYFKSNDIKEHNYNYDLDHSGNPITDEYYRLEAGFIAQEVREIPELKYCVEGKEYVDDFENCFKKDASGNNILDENNEPVLIPEYLGCIPNKLALSYTDIFVYNVVATQELDKKVNVLESENAELKTKNTELENEVATLKSELAAIKQHLGI